VCFFIGLHSTNVQWILWCCDTVHMSRGVFRYIQCCHPNFPCTADAMRRALTMNPCGAEFSNNTSTTVTLQ
jgi:hypothetical protein